jgi:hypothetical protein
MSPNLVALGSEKPELGQGTVRRYKCDNEKCGQTFVDVGIED